MKKMTEVAEEHKKRKRRTVFVNDIYKAPTDNLADVSIALIPLRTGRKSGRCHAIAMVTGRE